jgi:hypothetical protein
MVSTKHESRGESIGSFPSTPRTPPRSTRSTGFRTKWHTLSSSARGYLCIHPPDDAYENHWPSDSRVALHAPARSKSQPSSRNATPPPWNVVRGKSCPTHTKKVAKREAREAIRDDKMTTAAMATMAMTAMTATMKFSPSGSKPSSEGAASVNGPPQIEESGARRPGSESPLYDDHVGTPLHFNGSQSRAEEAERQHIATGDTIEALIDAILQIGDSEEEAKYDSARSSLADAPLLGTEAAIDDKSMIFGVEEGVGEGERREEKATKDCAALAVGAGEEDSDPPPDARRAWEDMKKRVMNIEQFGALPLDGGAASAGDAERASREFRARRRRSWAEKTIRVHAPPPPREETKGRRTAANSKKRRRHAGCWIREDGVFMRLVSKREHLFYFFIVLVLSCMDSNSLAFFFTRAFTVRTSDVRPELPSHSALPGP